MICYKKQSISSCSFPLHHKFCSVCDTVWRNGLPHIRLLYLFFFDCSASLYSIACNRSRFGVRQEPVGTLQRITIAANLVSKFPAISLTVFSRLETAHPWHNRPRTSVHPRAVERCIGGRSRVRRCTGKSLVSATSHLPPIHICCKIGRFL